MSLCLPSGKWIQISPMEARETQRHRRKGEVKNMKVALEKESLNLPATDDEAAETAWMVRPPPVLSGSNAKPMQTTSNQGATGGNPRPSTSSGNF